MGPRVAWVKIYSSYFSFFCWMQEIAYITNFKKNRHPKHEISEENPCYYGTHGRSELRIDSHLFCIKIASTRWRMCVKTVLSY